MNSFFYSSKLMTGDRALSNLPHELKMKNASRPMVISEKMESYAPFYHEVKKAFDNDRIKIPCIVVSSDDIADVDTINNYIEQYKTSGADSIVAIGREAVISIAKMVKLGIEQGVNDVSTLTHIAPSKSRVPLYIVSLFYGTGDEARGFARCYKDKTSYDFVSESLFPDAVIVDTKMIYKPSDSIMSTCLMYALASSIIAYTSKESGPMTRATAMASIQTICNSVNDKEFKRKPYLFANDIATSMVIAGAALSQVKKDDLAVMSSVVSRHLKVPYSKVYSLLFPHYYEEILDRENLSQMQVLLPIIGEERYVITPVNKRAEEVSTAVRKLMYYLRDSTGFRYNLSDYKMKRDDIETVAREIASKGIDYKLAYTILFKTY